MVVSDAGLLQLLRYLILLAFAPFCELSPNFEAREPNDQVSGGTRIDTTV